MAAIVVSVYTAVTIFSLLLRLLLVALDYCCSSNSVAADAALAATNAAAVAAAVLVVLNADVPPSSRAISLGAFSNCGNTMCVVDKAFDIDLRPTCVTCNISTCDFVSISIMSLQRHKQSLFALKQTNESTTAVFDWKQKSNTHHSIAFM